LLTLSLFISLFFFEINRATNFGFVAKKEGIETFCLVLIAGQVGKKDRYSSDY